MDTQQVEITGRSLLISVFVSENLEVAQPLRDKGIDLIVYMDDSIHGFGSLPIQLKSARKETFSISKKYLNMPNLYMAYVWHVEKPQESSIFIMRHTVAVSIAENHGYTKNNSWTKEKGEWSVSSISDQGRLKQSLEPYRYMPGNMNKLLGLT